MLLNLLIISWKMVKKGTAEKIFYGAMDIIKNKTKTDFKIFKKAIENASPSVEVKSRRIGGATYQVPIEVPKNRAFYLASLWIINSSNNSSGKPMSLKLAGELISAANGEGAAIKRKKIHIEWQMLIRLLPIFDWEKFLKKYRFKAS